MVSMAAVQTCGGEPAGVDSGSRELNIQYSCQSANLPEYLTSCKGSDLQCTMVSTSLGLSLNDTT